MIVYAIQVLYFLELMLSSEAVNLVQRHEKLLLQGGPVSAGPTF